MTNKLVNKLVIGDFLTVLETGRAAIDSVKGHSIDMYQ